MNGVWHHDSRYWRHRCEHGFEVEGTNASTRCQKTSKGCPLILCCATSPDLVVMLQHSTISLSAVLPEMDIPPTLPGGTQVDKLVHWSGLINSLPTLACLWPIHFLWYRIVHSGGQSHLLRLQSLHVSDSATTVKAQWGHTTMGNSATKNTEWQLPYWLTRR